MYRVINFVYIVPAFIQFPIMKDKEPTLLVQSDAHTVRTAHISIPNSIHK